MIASAKAPHSQPTGPSPSVRRSGAVTIAAGRARAHGLDVRRACGGRLMSTPEDEWPDLLLMLGDQVYADELSPPMIEFIEQRRGLDEPLELLEADQERLLDDVVDVDGIAEQAPTIIADRDTGHLLPSRHARDATGARGAGWRRRIRLICPITVLTWRQALSSA